MQEPCAVKELANIAVKLTRQFPQGQISLQMEGPESIPGLHLSELAMASLPVDSCEMTNDQMRACWLEVQRASRPSANRSRYCPGIRE